MFLDIDRKDPDSKAIIDGNGLEITYGELCGFSDDFSDCIGKRSLIFILCENCVGAASAYIASLSKRIVPLLLSEKLDTASLNNFINTYRPEFIWAKSSNARDFGEPVWERYGFSLIKTGLEPFPLYSELSLLLPTSGSTGTPKLVRHSYNNVESNARKVSSFFELDKNERPMLDSPIHYTYGLSILSSHIYAGASVLLTSATVLNNDYWDFFKSNKATSITGVPYTYELLKKLRFFRMNLPSLRTISQGGGKLSDNLFAELAQYSHNTGKRFVPTYGQTEGTARMTGLPSEYTREKCGSIGKAIPGGETLLLDENGNEIKEPGKIGELVFKGSNVTLGYATCGDELIKGDERNGILNTGDLAKMDEDGFLYITGRKSRFLKLWGTRVGLDETEFLIKEKFGVECACTGDDDKMKIFVLTADIKEAVKEYVATKTHINPIAFEVIAIEAFPRNDAGKILYSSLRKNEISLLKGETKI